MALARAVAVARSYEQRNSDEERHQAGLPIAAILEHLVHNDIGLAQAPGSEDDGDGYA